MTAVMEEVGIRERFEKVMAARKTSKELIGLLDKLADSKVFTAEEKPTCFGLLVARAAEKAKPEDSMSLLTAIRRTEAMLEMRKAFSYDEAEVISAKVVRRLLTSVPVEHEPLVRVMDALERCKVTLDRGNCLSLAVLSGMDMDLLDRIADLSAYDYDPAKVAAPAEPKGMETLDIPF